MLPLNFLATIGLPDSKLVIASLSDSVEPLVGIAAPYSPAVAPLAVAKADQLKIKANHTIFIRVPGALNA